MTTSSSHKVKPAAAPPAVVSDSSDSLEEFRSGYRAAADLLDGYVHESHFLRDDDSPDNHIVWASDGFTAIFGCTIDQYNRAKTWGGLYHGEERDAAIERARALRRGQTVEAEVRVLQANGEVRWIHVKNRPLYDPQTRRVTGVLGIGQNITQRKEAEAGLRALECEIINVANREQQRIAHDLHDGLGQDLAGIAMLLRSIATRHAVHSPELAASLEETIGLVNRSIQEARTLARGLSPLEIGYGGLMGALASMSEHARHTSGVNVRFVRARALSSEKPLSEADDHLYRIACEAVHNALRHSGAKAVGITLRPHRGGLLLQVRDDGCGIPENRAPNAGMGLRIMDYRARMIGAQLSVRRRPFGGTIVLCHLPSLPDGIAA